MIRPNGQVVVDNSLLRSVASCDFRGWMRHGQGYTTREEAIAAYAGQAWHEVMADYLRAEPDERLVQKFELLYHGYSNEFIPDDPKGRWFRLRWENVDAILKEWLVQHPVRGLPFAVNKNLVEVGFQVPLSDECVCGHPEKRHRHGWCQWKAKCKCQAFVHAFVFYGRLDALVTAEHDRGLYVLDHKTTGRLTQWKIEEYRHDSQMSGYVWAARQTTGSNVIGIYISAVELSSLPNSERKCLTHGAPYSECGSLHMKSQLLVYNRTQDQLDEWHATALELARRYRKLCTDSPTLDHVPQVRTQGTFHGACIFCDFKDYCAAGRPQDSTMGTLLLHEPWVPFVAEEK